MIHDESPVPHEAIGPIAFLLGTWRGEGVGEYPTIQTFGYREEVEFWHVGKPFLAYRQRTWSLADGPLLPSRLLHSETGFWRPQPGGRIEVVMAHPNGIVEVLEGTVRDTAISLESTVIARTSTAKEVTAIRRTFEVHDTFLVYTLDMAAVGQPLQQHLRAILRRVE